MEIQKLSDTQLLADLKSTAATEREFTVKVLEYLLEVERRELFLTRGYQSMFAFCRGFLSYSEGEAFARIQAMRLMRTLPDVSSSIESGELSLTVAAKVQTAFRREEENRGEIPISEKESVLKSLTNTSTRDADQKLAELFPDTQKPTEKMKPVRKDLVKLEFTVTKTVADKLNRLKGLLAHKNFEGRLDKLLEELVELGLKKFDPLYDLNDAALLETSQVKARHDNDSRYVPLKTRKIVWARANGRCQYIDPVTKTKCNSTHGLQVDHIKEFAKGGTSDLHNLRLLCGAHNRLRNAQAE